MFTKNFIVMKISVFPYRGNHYDFIEYEIEQLDLINLYEGSE